jgi:hypothetical protein
LALVDNPGVQLLGDDAFAMDFEALQIETSDLEKRHLQELALAFASGLFTLVAGLAVFRVCSRRTSRLSVFRNDCRPFESARTEGLAPMVEHPAF